LKHFALPSGGTRTEVFFPTCLSASVDRLVSLVTLIGKSLSALHQNKPQQKDSISRYCRNSWSNIENSFSQEKLFSFKLFIFRYAVLF
jgi:hypothetical protein